MYNIIMASFCVIVNKRLNIWDMISYDSEYTGFATLESMTSERISSSDNFFGVNLWRKVRCNLSTNRHKPMKISLFHITQISM